MKEISTNPQIKALKKLLIDVDLDHPRLAARCEVSTRFISYLLRGERRSKKYEPCVARELKIPLEKLRELITPLN